ncbi:hypothetical protein OC846_005029 [Tilletia horrida]|uniref:Inhibitor of apoptosis repeat-containing protein n=1 Tax=Tilletia horrida TaxID=155126 RepID=A0AAN6JS63_9BASI|nr:hypothetical protein OC846_005029 [Tilletia horrida]KAK0564867.1 hypothetical protein OC861_004044 [Tilletia horrida]
MSMAIETERLASFTSIRPAWPHPIPSSTGGSRSRSTAAAKYPSPDSLAAASLYYSPSPDAPDNCTSFIDGTNLSDWQPGDDPVERLRELKPSHPWILILSSKEAYEGQSSAHASGSISSKHKRNAKSAKSRGDKTQDVEQDPQGISPDSCTDPRLLPTSEAMIAARKATFGNEWPHDAKRGWSCTSAKVAAAGFHYNPGTLEDDNATCAYCGKELAGWEKEDDPIDEHRRRKPECPFFKIMPSEEADAAEQEEPSQRIKKGRANVENASRTVKPSAKKTSARAVSTKKAGTAKGDAKEDVAKEVKGPEVEGNKENQPVVATKSESFLAGVDLHQTVENYLRAESTKAIQDYRDSAQQTINSFKERVAAGRVQIESMLISQFGKKRKRDEGGIGRAADKDDAEASNGDGADAEFFAN